MPRIVADGSGLNYVVRSHKLAAFGCGLCLTEWFGKCMLTSSLWGPHAQDEIDT
ncbi:MAG TPA: hypothetical protein VGM05_15510 [Planctomycetaceae bacterium]